MEVPRMTRLDWMLLGAACVALAHGLGLVVTGP